MEKSNFDQLLNRYLTGEVSEQERLKIEGWLQVMQTEKKEDLTLSQDDEDKLFDKITSNLEIDMEVQTVPKQKPAHTLWVRMAAGLLILITASFGIWYVSQLGKASRSQRTQKLILQDGSLVWLRGESTINYYEKVDGVRYTELDGEALFEVKKDVSHPFIIQAGSVTLKVLGTSFRVRSMGDSMQLNVLTGKVSLSSNIDSVGLEVMPKEKVFYSRGKFSKTSMDNKELSALTADTEYVMDFSNATLADVAQRLEEKFDVDIKLKEPTAGRCHITADLTDQSLETSLNMIGEVLEVTYSKTDKTYVLHGQGCD
jgi:ferric-dicitrate binding protein FerR (iron transport regulator)